MKKSLLLAFALLLSVAVFAQTRTTFINEHFDTSIPDGWTVADQGQSNWYLSGTQNAGGQPKEVLLTWSPQFNGTARLCTPALDLTGVSNVVFSFKHALDNYSGSQKLSICTSSDGGTTWNEGWYQNYSSSSAYQVSQVISTSDMGNNSVMFCIAFTGNSYNINNWYFDDVEIFSQENLDLAASSIDIDPTDEYGETGITFTVTNRGLTSISSFNASYTISNGEEEETVTQDFTCSISSLNSQQFTFSEEMYLLPGTYNITITINSVNGGDDDDEANNTLTGTFNAAMASVQRTVMIEHFSSSTCSPCVSPNVQMHNLTNNNPGKFTYTKYQMNWPGNGDPYYTEEGGVRRSYYGVNAVPAMFYDSESFSSTSQAVFDSYYNRPAYSEIRGSFNVDGTTITADIDVMAYENLNGMKLFVSVNEKETHNNTGSNGETVFYHIFMKMLSDTSGDDVNVQAGESQHFTYTMDLAGTHVEEMTDLEVAAWVQNYSSKEMKNSHYLYEYTDIHPYPVQNLTFDTEGEGYDMIAAWEAPEGGNALSYNVYLNGELVENITETSYEIEGYVGSEFYMIEVEALYADDMASVRIAKTLVDHTGVAENNDSVKSNIYPNPTNGSVYVKGQNINMVNVYNICGQQLVSVKANSDNVNVNLGNVASGVYMVEVIDNYGNATVNKVVKR